MRLKGARPARCWSTLTPDACPYRGCCRLRGRPPRAPQTRASPARGASRRRRPSATPPPAAEQPPSTAAARSRRWRACTRARPAGPARIGTGSTAAAAASNAATARAAASAASKPSICSARRCRVLGERRPLPAAVVAVVVQPNLDERNFPLSTHVACARFRPCDAPAGARTSRVASEEGGRTRTRVSLQPVAQC